ncbi:MAG: RNHCP domain-containing protein [Candidatus Zixiibacteriota bacterium]|nr:MAG: RNHCP domain-containing protein [candidate division Zixibacteria bacterium]
MSQKKENTGFVCLNCGLNVVKCTNGSYRNHCPKCLYSLHVDTHPGDRSSDCGGLMKPLKIIHHARKGYQIVHKCDKCGAHSTNRIADMTEQPDDWEMVISLSC